jgi:SWI/SNF-related matrix-associated actin-dependent regulator 1 of chromatin subfamily A
MKHFPKAVKIDGSVSPSQRQKIVEQFQNDPNTKLFIGNIEAAGVGITLTAASNAAILEFPWKPSTLNQAMDRIHRITQTKQVTIWQLVAVDTIEEKIIDLLKKKENIVANVLDGKMYVDESIFMDLIESYRKIKK